MFKISQQQAQAVLDYLSKQPYVEVFQLIAVVQNLEPIEEPKKEKKNG